MDTTEETSQTSTGVKRKRTEAKDPNAPKRPATAYIFFNTEMRPKVKEEHPEMGLAERSKLVGKMWGNLKPEKKQVCRLLCNKPVVIKIVLSCCKKTVQILFFLFVANFAHIKQVGQAFM